MVDKVCTVCSTPFRVTPKREATALFCKRACYDSARKGRDRKEYMREYYAARKEEWIAKSVASNLKHKDARAKRQRERYPQTRPRKMAQLYGISVEEVTRLLAVKTCAICGGEAEHIDHDHTTKVVRGRLCSPCNLGLGMFKDNADHLLAARQYLMEAAA
jgi:Recombination endonuclease VII